MKPVSMHYCALIKRFPHRKDVIKNRDKETGFRFPVNNTKLTRIYNSMF